MWPRKRELKIKRLCRAESGREQKAEAVTMRQRKNAFDANILY